MSKYGAKRVKLDGINFSSKIEGMYYEHLKQLERAKQIAFFINQPKYVLQESYIKNGKKIRPITYVADFEITHLNGSVEVIDVKGFETEVFKIKKKMFECRYPDHEIKCVNFTKKYGWETLEDMKLRRKSK